MKSAAFLALVFLSLPATGFPGEPESGFAVTAMGGFDAGYSPGFHEFGGLSFALNAGYLERRGIYLGGQVGFSREILCPPFGTGGRDLPKIGSRRTFCWADCSRRIAPT